MLIGLENNQNNIMIVLGYVDDDNHCKYYGKNFPVYNQV